MNCASQPLLIIACLHVQETPVCAVLVLALRLDPNKDALSWKQPMCIGSQAEANSISTASHRQGSGAQITITLRHLGA